MGPLGQDPLPRGLIRYKGQWHNRTNFSVGPLSKTGLPSGAYLFILATDIMGYMLADPSYKVEGLTLPKGGLVRDQTFTDDTALFLQGSPPNLDRAQNVLNIFCRTFGAKINWHKSATTWAIKKERDWQWGEEEGLRWIPDGEGTRYLESTWALTSLRKRTSRK